MPHKAQGGMDEALTKLGKRRRIRVFTRHYDAAMRLAELRLDCANPGSIPPLATIFGAVLGF